MAVTFPERSRPSVDRMGQAQPAPRHTPVARSDADLTVALFAARLKDAVDLDSVHDDLASVVVRAL